MVAHASNAGESAGFASSINGTKTSTSCSCRLRCLIGEVSSCTPSRNITHKMSTRVFHLVFYILPLRNNRPSHVVAGFFRFSNCRLYPHTHVAPSSTYAQLLCERVFGFISKQICFRFSLAQESGKGKRTKKQKCAKKQIICVRVLFFAL